MKKLPWYAFLFPLTQLLLLGLLLFMAAVTFKDVFQLFRR